jgi:hypothetical protein
MSEQNDSENSRVPTPAGSNDGSVSSHKKRRRGIHAGEQKERRGPESPISDEQKEHYGPESSTSDKKNDRRRLKTDLDSKDKCVGQLLIKYDCDIVMMSSGTVFHQSKDSFTVITTANGLVFWEDGQEIRTTSITIVFQNGKSYTTNSFVFHPSYQENPIHISGFDLALITFKGVFPHPVCPICPLLLPNGDYTNSEYSCSIYGYPADKHGQYWGQSRKGGFLIDSDMIFYDIDTFDGQGGSPVLTDYGICAIHSGKSVLKRKKCGTKLTYDKIIWINSHLESDKISLVGFDNIYHMSSSFLR